MTEADKAARAYMKSKGLITVDDTPTPSTLLGTPKPKGQVTQNDDEVQLPKPKIGETVVTPRMAEKVYQLHNRGWSSRRIAQYFTELGNPVSYRTISRVINRYELGKVRERSFWERFLSFFKNWTL